MLCGVKARDVVIHHLFPAESELGNERGKDVMRRVHGAEGFSPRPQPCQGGASNVRQRNCPLPGSRLAFADCQSTGEQVNYLLRITELELLDRERRATERRIRQAKFPVVKTMDSFDFLAIPSLNKTLVLELARCEFLARRENVLLLGNSGTGKTHIALALGLAACQRGHRVRFTTTAALVSELIEVQDTLLLGGHLFTHIHIVNEADTSVSVRRVSLTNSTTGKEFRAQPFGKASLMKKGKIKVEMQWSLEESHTKESRVFDQFDDLLNSLTTKPLVKGEGRSGWLLFQGHHCSQPSLSALSLSMHVEDAFGDMHDSQVMDIPAEYGVVSR